MHRCKHLQHPLKKELLSRGIPSLYQGSQQCQQRLNHKRHSRAGRQAVDQHQQMVRGCLQIRSLPTVRQREARAPWKHRPASKGSRVPHS